MLLEYHRSTTHWVGILDRLAYEWMMTLSFSDFRPILFVFEVRYPEAFLLWDRAGQVATQLQARYPVSRLNSAEPGKIVFICDRTKEITWQLDRLIIIDHRPGSAKLEAFYDLC